MKKTIVKAAVLTLAALTALMLCSCSLGRKTIDLSQCIEVKYTSFNGYASANYDIDNDAIDKLVDSKKVMKYSAKVLGSEEEVRDYYGDISLSDLISITLDSETPKKSDHGYSNGDVLKFNVVINGDFEEAGQNLEQLEKGLGIKFKENPVQVTVSGLEEAKKLDVFGKIENYITYTGANGGGEVVFNFPEDYEFKLDDFYFRAKGSGSSGFEIISNNTYIGSVDFSCDCKTLKKGDKAKIDVHVESSELTNKGYVIDGSAQLTVPDLGEYITDASKLTAEQLNTLKTAALEDNSSETVIGVYFGTLKGSSTKFRKSDNCIMVVSKGQGFFGEKWYVTSYYDTVVKPDGKLDYKPLSLSGFSDDLNSIVENFDASYTYNKIG